MKKRLKDIKIGESFHVSRFPTLYMRISEEAEDGMLAVHDPRNIKTKFETIPVVCLKGKFKGMIRSFDADLFVVLED